MHHYVEGFSNLWSCPILTCLLCPHGYFNVFHYYCFQACFFGFEMAMRGLNFLFPWSKDKPDHLLDIWALNHSSASVRLVTLPNNYQLIYKATIYVRHHDNLSTCFVVYTVQLDHFLIFFFSRIGSHHKLLSSQSNLSSWYAILDELKNFPDITFIPDWSAWLKLFPVAMTIFIINFTNFS